MFLDAYRGGNFLNAQLVYTTTWSGQPVDARRCHNLPKPKHVWYQRHGKFGWPGQEIRAQNTESAHAPLWLRYYAPKFSYLDRVVGSLTPDGTAQKQLMFCVGHSDKLSRANASCTLQCATSLAPSQLASTNKFAYEQDSTNQLETWQLSTAPDLACAVTSAWRVPQWCPPSIWRVQADVLSSSCAGFQIVVSLLQFYPFLFFLCFCFCFRSSPHSRSYRNVHIRV